jgi:hypothetical protein
MLRHTEYNPEGKPIFLTILELKKALDARETARAAKAASSRSSEGITLPAFSFPT